jgi:hypothetical protein
MLRVSWWRMKIVRIFKPKSNINNNITSARQKSTCLMRTLLRWSKFYFTKRSLKRWSASTNASLKSLATQFNFTLKVYTSREKAGLKSRFTAGGVLPHVLSTVHTYVGGGGRVSAFLKGRCQDTFDLWFFRQTTSPWCVSYSWSWIRKSWHSTEMTFKLQFSEKIIFKKRLLVRTMLIFW